jgi:hypothetical protein
MSVLRQCSVFAYLVLCTLCVDVCRCTASPADKSKEDSISYADTLSAIQKIVDEIPAESQPKDSRDATGTLQRDKANQWLAENLVGKPVEFSIKITKVSIAPVPGYHGVKGAMIEIANEQLLPNGMLLIDAGKLHSGGTNWQLFYVLPKPQPHGKLDEAASERLQQLKGKTVKVTATVSDGKKDKKGTTSGAPIFSIDKVYAAKAHQVLAERTLQIHLSNISIEGFDSEK